MARVQYTDLVVDGSGKPLPNATVAIGVHTGSRGSASLWAAETGTATLSSVVTNSHGVFTVWLDEGRYDVLPSGSTSRVVDLPSAGAGSDFIVQGLVEGEDSTTAIQAAVNALPTNGGKLIFPEGAWEAKGELDFHGKHSIILQGVGGLSAGAACASSLKCTGALERFINARSTYGFILRDLEVYSGSGFKGKLIDLSHDPTLKTDSAYWHLERCLLSCTDTTAAEVLYLDEAITGAVAGCHIVGGKYGIVGVSVEGHYCNGITLSHATTFREQGTAQILNRGEGWTIDGCVFETLAGEKGAGALAQSLPVANGGSIKGCWFGDVTGSGGTQIVAGSGDSICGNLIGGSATSTGVSIPAGAVGVVVQANTFNTHENGIVTSATAVDCVIAPNSFISVTHRTPTPTISPEAEAGTGATATLTGNNERGILTVKTGEPGAAEGKQALVTTSYKHSVLHPLITPANASAAALEAWVEAVSETEYRIVFKKTPAAKTSYEFNYYIAP